MANDDGRSRRPRRRSSVDMEWFRGLYDEALPVVYGYFFKRCGGRRDVAADLTHDTFLSALRTLEGGASVDEPLPWLVTIARRRFIDHLRRRERRRSAMTHEEVWVGPGWTSDTEVRLIEALDRLSDDHRLVLVLRYVDDLAIDEVANLMGRSVRAVESLLVRARAALRDMYAVMSERTGDGI